MASVMRSLSFLVVVGAVIVAEASLRSVSNAHRQEVMGFAGDASEETMPKWTSYFQKVPQWAKWGGIAATLAIVATASFLVWRWNGQLKSDGKVPSCGWKSVVCGICCTPLACCLPIDEKEK